METDVFPFHYTIYLLFQRSLKSAYEPGRKNKFQPQHCRNAFMQTARLPGRGAAARMKKEGRSPLDWVL
ncbi:hypothetical protein DRA42_11705 [Ethanoligenens harbinense]|nr:hypothetical protein CXQ68_11670 [Ethanoligenens harbinense YUAN-3]AYF39467.1 hypothetical protein CXP51_11565 [Ethanoligenens harbinense]AYF42292.1 hypothetical protein CN246_12115 [Ethanoligenens harbinense]QCN93046.1 hypothetical protein DRA42_11705 [Ethanoligenens harbinense]